MNSKGGIILISINDLYFSYTKKSNYIINNLNLTINKGDYVSILGKNGCGKSTFIKLLLGLLKPSSGNIKIHSNKIGYVPQRMDTFNSQFPITVYEILKCHLRSLKLKDTNIIKESLSALNMYDFKNHLIGNLSGGQQQKVFIVRALMGNPDILILDEPSTGIDTQSQTEIYNIIKNLNRNLKITVISVEHNLKAALENSSHILEFNNSTKNMLLDINTYKEIN